MIFTSAYDAANNRTSLAEAIAGVDDFLSSSTYNALNQLTRLDQTGQSGGNSVAEKRIDFAYNAIGQFTSIARYKDTTGGSTHEIATSTYSYDLLNRLTGLVYKEGSTNLFTPYAWSFDNLSRVTQQVSEDGTSDYAYDSTSQLTTADHDYQTDETYSYDANGNRTMTGYSTGTNNRLLNDGTHTYTYDHEGNRLSRTNNALGTSTEYQWDTRNRLTQVTEKDVYGATISVVAYSYDAFNRRISRAVDSSSPFDLADAVIERFVYDDASGVASADGGNVVLDFVDTDGAGSAAMELQRRYLYGAAVDQILAQEDVSESPSSAERVVWFLADDLGTTRDLIDNAGDLAEHYQYDAYGRVVSGDTSLTRYLYTSREHDAATGLQYNRARWYDPAVGRWISEDPIGFAAGDGNLNRYVGNSPASGNDPSGLIDSRYYATAEGQQEYASWMDTGIGNWTERSLWQSISSNIYQLSTDGRAMLSNPSATLAGYYRGLGDGAAMVANAITLHQIDTLNEYTDELIATNGGLYGTANAFANGGVAAGYAAVGVYAWAAMGGGQFAIGLSPGAGVLPHVTYGYGSGGTYLWAHGVGNGLFTTTAFAAPGTIGNVYGIPIFFPGAIGTWVGTRPNVGNCAYSCLQAYLRGMRILW